jgi:hypothetical protein
MTSKPEEPLGLDMFTSDTNKPAESWVKDRLPPSERSTGSRDFHDRATNDVWMGEGRHH